MCMFFFLNGLSFWCLCSCSHLIDPPHKVISGIAWLSDGFVTCAR